MLELNILRIKVNGTVVYEKNKELATVQNGDSYPPRKNSANSLESDMEVLPCKEALEK